MGEYPDLPATLQGSVQKLTRKIFDKQPSRGARGVISVGRLPLSKRLRRYGQGNSAQFSISSNDRLNVSLVNLRKGRSSCHRDNELGRSAANALRRLSRGMRGIANYRDDGPGLRRVGVPQKDRMMTAEPILIQVHDTLPRERIYDPANYDPWLDEKQVAQILGLSPSALRAMRRRGEGPIYVRLANGHIRYRPIAIRHCISVEQDFFHKADLRLSKVISAERRRLHKAEKANRAQVRLVSSR
jgi:Helix-turn-helix domain